jgi:nucleotide-binding universal stress UspA family protein
MKKSLKQILVPLDPSIYAQAAVRSACQIAKKHGAGVAGVVVLDSPEIRSQIVPAIGPYYPMMIEVVKTRIDHARDVLDDCLKLFASECEKSKVPHLETSYEGIPAQKLLSSAMFYDLLVMGLETSFHFETRGGRGDTLDKLLQETVVPILAVPSDGLMNPKSVLITFDGSHASARAIHDFLVFASAYEFEITIAVAEKKESEGEFLAKSAAALLETHGQSAGKLLISDEPIEEVVTDELLEATDLVVAGIHSKRPIKDRFVGSFTRKLIQDGTTALFLSH